MNSFLGQRRVILACLLALGVAATAPSVSLAAARPDPTVKKTGFRLFARAGGSLRVNQVQCGIISDGQICVDSTGSSTIPGSVWPKGTNNQYTFNSGISIAGVIGPEVAAWAGDTTGAFFFDGGGKQNGEQVEPIYNASDPADFNAWPAFARVPDGSDPGADIYDPLLQGTVSASQGDVYFLTWDGNPTALTGRPHPMGVLVETRGLAWNFPTGNQDIIYFVYTLYNITSINDVDYGDVRPGLKAVLLAKAQEFQTKNEAAFGIDIPAGGYALQDVFMAFAADQDVTAAAGANYSTFNIPFATAVTYHERFEPAPGNTFDPGIHAPPFLPGPGFVGTKYLRSPIIEGSSPPQEVGLALATLTTLRGAFPDPNNTSQLYRYMSATINPGAGDPQCNTGDPTVTKICFINNNPSDTRTFQSSGPLQLAPGGQATIVVGYIFAAPLATGKCPTIPCPVTMRPAPLTILNATPGNAGVDAIDSAMGYRGLSPTAGSPLTQQDFLVEPNSLLAKALVAQTVFDNKFLLPFAPTAPEFFVVPGNAQVSILWRPSSSEASGDAFFTIASNPQAQDDLGNPIPNPLYDPNYRSDDVEGYRIYRGRTDTPNQLELLAQFDYGETFISDHRGIVYAAENPTCAPELSVTAGCTAPFDNPAPGAPFVQHVDVPLVGDVIQTKPGDRVELANGEILVTSADTALIGGGSGLPPLADTGIPFAFTDDGSGLLSAPRNNVRYFYSVTAFDVNSFFSGPSSLESQRVTKPVTPTRPASNVEAASLSSGIFGDDGTELNPKPATPFLIDAQTGRFSGPPPATGVASLQGVFAPLVPVLLPSLNLTGKLDSVLPRSGATCAGVANFQGLCYEFFVTFTRDATSLSSSSLAQWPIWTGFSEPSSVQNQLGAFAVEPDAVTAARFGIPQGAASFNAAIGATMAQNIRFSAHEGQLGRRVGGSSTTAPSTATLFVSPGGSRWFEGANESVNDPTYSIRVGHLPGVDTIFAPTSHIDQDPTTTGIQPTPTGPLTSTCLQVLPYVVAPLSRQADIELTWGAGGQIASVRDITNHIDVPFKRAPQASYGFIPDRNGNGAIDWTDIYGVEGIAPAVSSLAVTAAFCTVNHDPGVAARPPLTAQPTIGPVSTVVSTEAPGGLTSTGTGFGLYINGQQFLFQLTGGQPPAAGTKWTLRSYSGTVLASAATAATTDPSGYTFAPVAGSPSIPGLEIRFTVDQATQVNAPAPGNLDAVHTVPDPYYVTSAFETTTENKVIKFVNLPNQAIIRIYSSSGVLVSVLEHNSVTLGGDETWNVRNRNNQIVASGVYFYHIEAANQRKVGRFTVVNFAQ